MDRADHLQRHKKPNIVNGQFVEEGEEDDVIAQEFSSDGGDGNEPEGEDIDEFMEHEEEFEARQSVSSRGRDTRVQMMPEQNRATEVQRLNVTLFLFLLLLLIHCFLHNDLIHFNR